MLPLLKKTKSLLITNKKLPTHQVSAQGAFLINIMIT